jgi:iron-sulfur cluster insertion protein
MDDEQVMITFTDSAKQQIHTVMQQQEPLARLRIFVQGGGCNGLEYGFTIDQGDADPDDFTFEIDSLTVLVDAASMQYLQGSVIDFTQSLTESRFVINNPNATAKCGCGSSFAI